jgi:hypothetical protein
MAYVYGHYKADTGELFYIGKGQGDRAWSRKNRNRYWNFVVSKHGFEVIILENDLTEEQALQKEKELIVEIGLDKLTNIAEGGAGFTSETARMIVKQLWSDPKYKKMHSERMKKQWQEPEYRAYMQRLNERQMDPKYRKQRSETTKNLFKSEEYVKAWRSGIERGKSKVSEASKKAWQDPVSRAKRLAPKPCPNCGRMIPSNSMGRHMKGSKCL